MNEALPAPVQDMRTTLLELLAADTEVREAIRQLLAPTDEADAASAGFAAERQLLDCLAAEPGLRDVWLSVDEPVERQLVRLIASASQWDRLLLLRDRLAERCKEEQRSASARELQILAGGLALHNLIWQEHQATLLDARIGTSFDPLSHERGSLNGHAISEQWLPGLCNAAGQVQRKPLVRT